MRTLTISSALAKFYEKNKFDSDGGEHAPYAKAQLTSWFFIYVPNPDARQRILHIHDIHHLVAGFETSMRGESEISAWEISSGCRSNWFAFYINTLGVMSLLPMNPKRIWKAFKLGKRTKNLYKSGYTKEQLLEMTVEEIQDELGFGCKPQKRRKSGFMTILSFVGFMPVGLLFLLIGVVTSPLVLLYTLYWLIKEA
jgi:hypothetical protein